MRLTIIGFWGGYPGRDGASSMYILEKDGFMIVLDVGSGGVSKFQKYREITDINAVLLSHYHADHIADVGVLQHALLIQSYLTDSVEIVPIYGHTEDKESFQKLNHDFTEAVRYDPKEAIKIGPFFIRFLKTEHSVVCYGMRITDGEHTIVYTADSAYQEEWIKFCQGADLLLSECNFYAGQDATKAGHMNSAEVATIAKRAGVKELILTHLPHFGDHKQLVQESAAIYDGKIQLAHEGLVWEGKKKEDLHTK